jgi:sulfur carrier protein ThiS
VPSVVILIKELFMRILFINNAGAGFADYLEVESGTTVAQLFSKHLPGDKPQDYLIRVNRLPVAAEQVLQEGDRVSITATKIAGA